jgi:hypothetical protein
MAIVSLAARAAQHARDVTGCDNCYTVAQVIGDAAKGYRGEPSRIAGLSLLVIEEASMIGSKQMARLLSYALGKVRYGLPCSVTLISFNQSMRVRRFVI